jgi:hypothetical protein
MTQPTPCLHKHIKIMEESRYTIPQGYAEAMEDENLDMANYFIEGNQSKVICEDCAEQLD